MEHFLDMPDMYTDYKKAYFVILGVPYDGTSTFVKGADKGRNIGLPKEEDWALMKLKTETSINNTSDLSP